MSKIKRGTRIRIVDGGVYLGRWLKPGEEGTVVRSGCARRHEPYTVLMDKDKCEYTLASTEFEFVEKVV